MLDNANEMWENSKKSNNLDNVAMDIVNNFAENEF